MTSKASSLQSQTHGQKKRKRDDKNDELANEREQGTATPVVAPGPVALSAIPLQPADCQRGHEVDVLIVDDPTLPVDQQKPKWDTGVVAVVNKKEGKLLIHVSQRKPEWIAVNDKRLAPKGTNNPNGTVDATGAPAPQAAPRPTSSSSTTQQRKKDDEDAMDD